MNTNSSSPVILIAGFPALCKNYEKALKTAGFAFVYPTTISHPDASGTHAPYTLSTITSLSYDLLLLPGGGDFSSLLYDLPADTKPELSLDRNGTKCCQPNYPEDLLQFQCLQLAVLQSKPILGICKGMQMINVYFGGNLYPDLPTAAQHQYIGRDQFHSVRFLPEFPSKVKIFGRERTTGEKLFSLLSSYPEVNSAHHQGICRLGNQLITLQYSDDYLPETIAHRTLPILGFQWHPERLPGFDASSMKKLLRLLLQSSHLCYTDM